MVTLLKTYLVDPLISVFMTVTAHVPTLVSALLVLVVGIILAKFIRDVLHRLLKEIRLDMLMDKMGLTAYLKKGGIKYTVSGLIGAVVYLLIIVTFAMKTLDILGITAVMDLVKEVIAYVPSVVKAVIVLVVGLVVASIVSKTIAAVTTVLDLPKPKLHERISRWAITIFTATIALREIGLMPLLESHATLIVSGVVLALALAFGLGGRDKAARYLDRK